MYMMSCGSFPIKYDSHRGLKNIDIVVGEQLVKESRCPLPPPLGNDIRIIAKQADLAYCEQVERHWENGLNIRNWRVNVLLKHLREWHKMRIVYTLEESSATLFLIE